MNRLLVRTAPFALLLLQVACTQAPPPAPDTRTADEKAIRDSETQWVKDFASRDLDRIVTHYADDASVLMPDLAIMTGKDAIRAGMKDVVADPAFALELQTVKVEVSKGADVAYSQGTYSYAGADPKTKKVMAEKGKYVEVYKKQADGSWKIVEDINNPDAPAAPAK
ncbi:MAG TPA: SgcJ/EcaC family oxidoreductase [Bryobacteraceae bacterium]|nr:SgcJ/EcaC family oxidoreductase [Bryobacteraceae bacterium]